MAALGRPCPCVGHWRHRVAGQDSALHSPQHAASHLPTLIIPSHLGSLVLWLVTLHSAGVARGHHAPCGCGERGAHSAVTPERWQPPKGEMGNTPAVGAIGRASGASPASKCTFPFSPITDSLLLLFLSGSAGLFFHLCSTSAWPVHDTEPRRNTFVQRKAIGAVEDDEPSGCSVYLNALFYKLLLVSLNV